MTDNDYRRKLSDSRREINQPTHESNNIYKTRARYAQWLCISGVCFCIVTVKNSIKVSP